MSKPVHTRLPVPGRQFVTELNLLTVALSGSCTAATCKTMNATDEWQYLCAAHKTPSEVCEGV